MYALLKLVHIVAVILFLGNITTGLFWHAHAARTRDPGLLAHTMEGIIRSDRLFTMPAVVAILVSGVVAASVGGLPILRTGWILWASVLFAVSGVLFAVRVAPLQRRLLALSQDAATFDFARYRAVALRWELWGGLALLTPLAALVLMVLKPDLRL